MRRKYRQIVRRGMRMIQVNAIEDCLSSSCVFCGWSKGHSYACSKDIVIKTIKEMEFDA